MLKISDLKGLEHNFHILSVTLTSIKIQSNRDLALGVLLTSSWDFC